MTHLAFLQPLLFEPGDRMGRDEFLRLWEKMPQLKFAELIDGIVYMPSPLSYEHGRLSGLISVVLGSYAARIATCELLVDATWLMAESAPQPDLALRLLPGFGGATSVTGELASGSPELIVEITKSSRSYDLGPKLALYQRAKVREYLVVLAGERRLEWRILENGSYIVAEPDSSGLHRSRVFPGLVLDEPALWANDAGRLLAALENSLP